MAYKISIKKKMKIYDAFPTEEGAKDCGDNMKDIGVEKVKIKKINEDSGRLKYGVYLGGKESSKYV